MTIRDFESFDLKSAAQIMAGTADFGWTGGSAAAIVAGRTGNCLNWDMNSDPVSSLVKVFDNQAEWYVAHAFRHDTANRQRIVSFYDGANLQCEYYVNTSRQFELVRNGTILATSTATYALNTWHHVEIHVVIHSSTGVMEIRLDGVSIISVTGANTRGGSSNNYANIVAISPASRIGGALRFDDLIYADGTSSQTWIGDKRVSVLAPTGAGNTTQMTPSAGSNWQNVDDQPANDDTDYNSDGTAGHLDTYVYGNLAANIVSVQAVKVVMRARKDDAGPRSIASVTRPGSTDNVGADKALTTTYLHHGQILLVNPDTAVAWTPGEVNATEFGVKLTV